MYIYIYMVSQSYIYIMDFLKELLFKKCGLVKHDDLTGENDDFN